MHIPFLDQWGVILIIGLLLFGKRLPEVGRSVGKGIVEFKKGLQGIDDELHAAGSNTPTATNTTVAPTNRASLLQQGYKFDPVTGEPLTPQIANSTPTDAKFDPYTGKPLSNETVASGSGSTTSSV